MKSFQKDTPSDKNEKLTSELLDKLYTQTNKFIEKNSTLDTFELLTILQNVGINYVCSLTSTCSQHIIDKSMQIDHIDFIKTSIDTILDMIKVNIKSVNLN